MHYWSMFNKKKNIYTMDKNYEYEVHASQSLRLTGLIIVVFVNCLLSNIQM